MAFNKIDEDKYKKVIDRMMSLPKPGDVGYEDMVDFMRADIKLNEERAKIERAARGIIKKDGRNFDEEFAKWQRENRHE